MPIIARYVSRTAVSVSLAVLAASHGTSLFSKHLFYTYLNSSALLGYCAVWLLWFVGDAATPSPSVLSRESGAQPPPLTPVSLSPERGAAAHLAASRQPVFILSSLQVKQTHDISHREWIKQHVLLKLTVYNSSAAADRTRMKERRWYFIIISCFFFQLFEKGNELIRFIEVISNFLWS